MKSPTSPEGPHIEPVRAFMGGPGVAEDFMIVGEHAPEDYIRLPIPGILAAIMAARAAGGVDEQLSLYVKLPESDADRAERIRLADGELIVEVGARPAAFDRNGNKLPIKGTSQLAVLGFLARHVDKVQTRERIIEAIWKETNPRSIRALNITLSRLRKALRQTLGPRLGDLEVGAIRTIRRDQARLYGDKIGVIAVSSLIETDE